MNDKTELLIEGYPRSGNTYCYAKYKLLNPSLHIASHRHEFGHIHYALLKRIPVVVVARNPLDTVSSLVIREHVSVSFALNYYYYFHKRVFSFIDQIRVFSFETLINNEELTLFNINEINFRKTTENEERKIKLMIYKMEQLDSGRKQIRHTHLAFPNKKKEEKKKYVKDLIREKYPKLLKKSDDIYNKILVNAHTSIT